ncbi:unnamed protein product [Arabis nemorensis]|uniref:Uncharacterized protein n=1 Tax=Arabis nemorensis TaxID=586526 RepID=A0A565C9F3_9BRAS|nr:unnamed protein product [Arabis nemorensis]
MNTRVNPTNTRADVMNTEADLTNTRANQIAGNAAVIPEFLTHNRTMMETLLAKSTE